MKGTTKVLLVAALAAVAGAGAGLLLQGGGLHPLLASEAGQRLLGGALQATAPVPPAGTVVARRGERVPALSLPGMDGQPVALPGAWPGRPLLVNLWATWCGPCIREMPELQRFADEQGSNGVQVVGIALDDAAAVQAFLQAHGIRYPILLDAAGPADAGVRLGNPKGVLPYSVLIDASGVLRKQRIGPFVEGEIDAWAR